MQREKTFGSFLRKCRLRAGYGLRSFAVAIEMKPSNLSNTEHDRISPPQDPEKLAMIADILGVARDSEDWKELHNLAVKGKAGVLPPDIQEAVGRSNYIPVLLRTISERQLSEEEILKLAKHIEEHYGKSGRRVDEC